jgi:catechol 2,3-dioxygenase-like lactoylglutathione lyase family enzyme
MSIFDHVGIDVRDYKRSRQFYAQALAPLGIKLVMDLEEWKAAGFGVERPEFWIGGGEPTHGDDEVHICFAAKDRAQVRAFYDAAIAAGGRDNGKPGPRPEYHEHYYGAFVLDLDGNNIEACCHRPE